jgi:hypothetical protein
MTVITNLGKWIFLSGFIIYVALHFALADVGARMVPSFLPFPYFWNYLTGVFVAMFVISGFAGKFDKLAALLMALYIFLVALLIHVPGAIWGSKMELDSSQEVVNIFRNMIAMGGALMYAGAYARDTRLIPWASDQLRNTLTARSG